MVPNIVYRYSEPSKLDTADYGTICKVKTNHDDKKDIYVQISKHEEPIWHFIGTYKLDIEDNLIIKDVKNILRL